MDARHLIDALGGTAAVAALVGVKSPSVSGWKESGRIPDDKRIRLAIVAERRGIATRQELFPDDYGSIWPELAANDDEHGPDSAPAPLVEGGRC